MKHTYEVEVFTSNKTVDKLVGYMEGHECKIGTTDIWTLVFGKEIPKERLVVILNSTFDNLQKNNESVCEIKSIKEIM